MIIKINDVDLIILKSILRTRKAYLKEIIEDIEKSENFKKLHYHTFYMRVNYLIKKKLIVITCKKPLLLKLNTEYYDTIVRFITSLAELEVKLWRK